MKFLFDQNNFFLSFLILLLLTSCGSDKQENNTDFTLDFPVKPMISTEKMPVRGKQVSLTIKSASTESDLFLLFEIELGELTADVKSDPKGFFNGMLTYLMTDLGLQYGNLSEFEYNGFKGNNFDILSLVKNGKNPYAKGKTLLIEDKAYIWFAISGDQNSKRVDEFVDSYEQD